MVVTCSKCKARLRLPETTVGKQMKCPKCGEALWIAAPSVRDPMLGDLSVQTVGADSPRPTAKRRPAKSGISAAFWGAFFAVAVAVAGGVVLALQSRKSEPARPTSTPTHETSSVPKDVSKEAPPQRQAMASEEIVAATEPSVALIRGDISTGTGFLVQPNVLVTNRHVIEGNNPRALSIQFPSAPPEQHGPCGATVLYVDEVLDLAFLRVASSLKPLPLAGNGQLKRGQDIIVIGNPSVGGVLSLENAISKGVLSTPVTIDGRDFYQLGISVNPGNSGGPVLDSQGKVIGVVTLKATQQEGVAFCIPCAQLEESIFRMQGHQGVADAVALPESSQVKPGLSAIQRDEISDLDRQMADCASRYCKACQSMGSAYTVEVGTRKADEAMAKFYELGLRRLSICVEAKDGDEAAKVLDLMIYPSRTYEGMGYGVNHYYPISEMVDAALDVSRFLDRDKRAFVKSPSEKGLQVEIEELVRGLHYAETDIEQIEKSLPLDERLLSMGVRSSVVQMQSDTKQLEQDRILRCRCLYRLAQIDLLKGAKDEAVKKLVKIQSATHKDRCPYEQNAADELAKLQR